MKNVFEVQPREPFVLRLDGKDYKVEYPVAAVAKLETQLGRPLKTCSDWWNTGAGEIQAILRTGLERQHPDAAAEVAEAFCGALPADEIEEMLNSLLTPQFPRAWERQCVPNPPDGATRPGTAL